MVVAIDFDDTMTVRSAYPEAGIFRDHCIDAIKNFQAHGIKCYLWTCRVGDTLRTAIQAIEETGLKLDGYNIGFYDEINPGARKPIADIYIDDRSLPWCLDKDSISWYTIEEQVLDYYNRVFKE